jgi:hypothetical protein
VSTAARLAKARAPPVARPLILRITIYGAFLALKNEKVLKTQLMQFSLFSAARQLGVRKHSTTGLLNPDWPMIACSLPDITDPWWTSFEGLVRESGVLLHFAINGLGLALYLVRALLRDWPRALSVSPWDLPAGLRQRGRRGRG